MECLFQRRFSGINRSRPGKHFNTEKGSYVEMSGTLSLSRTALSQYPLRKTMSQSTINAEFERVILPHLNSAYNLARWLLRNEQDSQDVVHDSFLRAHRYFESFDGSDGRAWLFGIVRNACFNFLRASKTQQIPTNEHLDLQSSGEATPEEAMMLEEDLRGTPRLHRSASAGISRGGGSPRTRRAFLQRNLGCGGNCARHGHVAPEPGTHPA